MNDISKRDPELLSSKKYDNVAEVNRTEVDRIAKSLAGRSLFITGGTGFLGLVLIEKLLRSCSDVKKIYVLIRHKKGKTPSQRIEEMFENVLFDTVIQQIGIDVMLRKVEAIYGDMTLEGLGISNEDIEKLCNEVSIVYHSAATTRFDEPLRYAIKLNVRGTQQMLDLVAKFKSLDLFCYVSTAYAHLHQKTLFEKPYEPPTDPHKAMAALEWLTDDQVEILEKNILKGIPNTYIYSKALSETLVVEKFKELPAVIMRPSIVMPTLKEPMCGWTNNMNGPVGLFVAFGKGVLQTMYGNDQVYGDMMPVDVCVDSMLVTTWHYLSVGLDQAKSRITHITNSNRNVLTWGEINAYGLCVVEKHVPFNGAVWYPRIAMTRNKISHLIRLFLFQWIPAILGDALLPLFGEKPFLIKIHQRISKGIDMLQYFSNHIWEFDNSQILSYHESMNSRERSTYYISNFGEINFIEYIKACVLCVRRNILKESDESLPAARKHLILMWYVDKIWKGLWLIALCYFVIYLSKSCKPTFL